MEYQPLPSGLFPRRCIFGCEAGLALDADKLDVLDTIAKAVEVPVQEGRFQMTDGKVTEFAESRVGKQLDRDATAAVRQLWYGGNRGCIR